MAPAGAPVALELRSPLSGRFMHGDGRLPNLVD